MVSPDGAPDGGRNQRVWSDTRGENTCRTPDGRDNAGKRTATLASQAHSGSPERRENSHMISFVCQKCGRAIEVSEELGGKKGKCDRCGAVILVPSIIPSPKPATQGSDFAETSPSRIFGKIALAFAALIVVGTAIGLLLVYSGRDDSAQHATRRAASSPSQQNAAVKEFPAGVPVTPSGDSIPVSDGKADSAVGRASMPALHVIPHCVRCRVLLARVRWAGP